MQHKENKTTKPLYISLEVYKKAQEMFGERGVSAAIQRLLETELYKTPYECRKCESNFTESAWRRHVPTGQCPNCGSFDIKRVI